MLVVTTIHAGDKALAVNLYRWLLQIGAGRNHECLLVYDKNTTLDGVIEPATEAFRKVHVCPVNTPETTGKWGDGTTDASAPNEMFYAAASYIYHKFPANTRWLLMEPDCVVMRGTALDEIEAEDSRANKPFMGADVNVPPHERHMSGNAVYPHDVSRFAPTMLNPGRTAWDYAGRKESVPKAHFTNLIQHDYRKHGEYADFQTQESLSFIRPETALFHRCKNGSAIDRLRERLTGQINPKGGEASLSPVCVEKPASVVAKNNAAQTSEPDALLISQLRTENDGLRRRLAELDGKLAQANARIESLSPPKTTFEKTNRAAVKNGRTPAQQAAINERMAKARAGRKKATA